jgi:fibronectin-binding autotransporter adhesin
MKPKFQSIRSSILPANIALSLGLAVAGLSTQSAKADATWTGAADTNWDNLSNWGGGDPSGGAGFVNTLTNYPVITANNTLVPNDLLIAMSAGTTGRMDIRAGTFTNNYWTRIGDNSGNATLNIADTTASGGTYTGFGTGSGSIVSANAAGNANFYVGQYQSTGVVNMNTTGHLDTQNLLISANSSDHLGEGTFNLDAGTVNVSNEFQVGSDWDWSVCGKNATLNMSGGTVNVGGVLSLGRYNNTISTGTSTVNMTGGTLNVEGDMMVGFAGLAGTKSIVNIANGATVNVGSTSERSVKLGHYDYIDVTMNVSNGGTLNLNAGSDINFATNGNSGTRVLNVDNGTINGTAGGGSYINMNNNGTAGTSTINIKNGGVVRVDYIVGAASSTLNFDNGTLKATASAENFIGDTMTINVKAGGAILDTNGFNSTVRGNLLDGDGLGGGVTKNGLGTLTLNAANTYSGGTTLNAGTLVVGNNSALGTGAVALNGGTLTDSNNGYNNDPTITNAIIAGGGAIAGGHWTAFHIQGNITGSAALGLSATFGDNGLRLQGDNSGYNGTATVTGANVRLGAATAGSAMAAWVVNGNLQTDVSGGATFNLGSLNGSGNISGHGSNASAAVSTLSVGALNTNDTFSGTIIDNAQNNAVSGDLDGGGNNVLALTKVGSGTLTLTGTNTYTGATAVSNGKLVVNGSISTSAVTVQNGAILGGIGTVGALTVESGGTVAPGNSPGILTVNGNYTQTVGTLSVELNGTSVGTQYDQVNVTGTVTLGGALAATLGYTPANGDILFILANDGADAINGTFADNADGSTFFLNGTEWKISYEANYTGTNTGTFTGGNDVALMAIPEPRAALLGGLGMLALLRRRRSA